ncbi:MAG: serine/threonine protein kinase, partial [Gemmatimonadetes bacterium]|nr:serine/threonine protein kinase [Gemmatimonadota bacterium]
MHTTTETITTLNQALKGRYRVEGTIGVGGMATVFVADDLRHERRVAIKVLTPGLDASLGSQRFLREIRIAAQLSHPLIVPVYDSGVVGESPFLVMPYKDGESLQARLAREPLPPLDEAIRIVADVAAALSYAHREGVVHRDIKPGNILLHGGHALVVDFGIAKALGRSGGSDLTAVGAAMGTPRYMAPEQAFGAVHPDHRADLYSVGAVAYELLTGRPPFTGSAAAIFRHHSAHDAPVPVTELRDDLPADLGQLVMKCLERDPENRWQSAEELLRAIGAHTQGQALAEATPSWKGKRRRHAFGLVAAGFGAAMLAGGGILGLSDPSESAVGEPSRAVVAVFDNQTGDPD